MFKTPHGTCPGQLDSTPYIFLFLYTIFILVFVYFLVLYLYRSTELCPWYWAISSDNSPKGLRKFAWG
jgi:hypothetical protein